VEQGIEQVDGQHLAEDGEESFEDLVQTYARRGMIRTVVVVTVVAIPVAFGAYLAVQHVFASPAKHTVTGTLTLVDASAGFTSGSSCAGSGGYSDITPGNNVTVYDGKQNIIATSTLGHGTGTFGACVLTFTVPDVPDEAFYKVEVSHRGGLSFSKTDMQAANWTVSMSLGH
jgi:hypothetical protein